MAQESIGFKVADAFRPQNFSATSSPARSSDLLAPAGFPAYAAPARSETPAHTSFAAAAFSARSAVSTATPVLPARSSAVTTAAPALPARSAVTTAAPLLPARPYAVMTVAPALLARSSAVITATPALPARSAVTTTAPALPARPYEVMTAAPALLARSAVTAAAPARSSAPPVPARSAAPAPARSAPAPATSTPAPACVSGLASTFATALNLTPASASGKNATVPISGSKQSTCSVTNHVSGSFGNLVIGERVVWIDDVSIKHGTARWIGRLQQYGSQMVVGLELDEPVGIGTGEYEGRQLFIVPSNHAAVVPLSGLIKEKDFLGANKSKTRELKDEEECQVCFEKKIDCAFYDCGHSSLCYECAIACKTTKHGLCPICRAVIRDVIRIYRP